MSIRIRSSYYWQSGRGCSLIIISFILCWKVLSGYRKHFLCLCCNLLPSAIILPYFPSFSIACKFWCFYIKSKALLHLSKTLCYSLLSFGAFRETYISSGKVVLSFTTTKNHKESQKISEFYTFTGLLWIRNYCNSNNKLLIINFKSIFRLWKIVEPVW